MKHTIINRNGFHLRTVQCDKCKERIIHPTDLQEFNHFTSLKNKKFRVKLRYVGNSYAISIPREIINFINEQEDIMNKLVSLCFEDMGKLSLMFREEEK